MYATPQLLDQFVWVPVRDAFISSCGHTGLTVLDAVLKEMEPPFAVSEAAEHALPLFSRLPPALDPVGSIPGSWRDRAIRAGRPSALLRREALAAREAAALSAVSPQQAQV
jgi:hypothetical protein